MGITLGNSFARFFIQSKSIIERNYKKLNWHFTWSSVEWEKRKKESETSDPRAMSERNEKVILFILQLDGSAVAKSMGKYNFSANALSLIRWIERRMSGYERNRFVSSLGFWSLCRAIQQPDGARDSWGTLLMFPSGPLNVCEGDMDVTVQRIPGIASCDRQTDGQRRRNTNVEWTMNKGSKSERWNQRGIMIGPSGVHCKLCSPHAAVSTGWRRRWCFSVLPWLFWWVPA